MSDEQACKSEDQHRIDTLEELTNAERELRSAKTRFEQAQWEVVKAAESLLELRDNWSRLRKAALSCYPDAVPVERVLEDAQATMDRFCAEVNARNADLDKAISALTPEDGNDALLADQQDTPPQSNAQASETDAANWQVRIIGLRDPITGKAFLARNVLSPPLSDEGLAMLEEAITNEMPEGFSVYHPEDMMFPVETMVEFWWPDGKREISAIDKDWTEAPFAYRIISEPAEASEVEAGDTVNQDGGPIYDALGEVSPEPSEPPSELDNQAQPQTKSEQSEIHHPDAQYWTKALEQDRKPQPGIIEETVSRLFGRKMEEV